MAQLLSSALCRLVFQELEGFLKLQILGGWFDWRRRRRFPLLIPCHRVVRGDGTIGNYLFGTDAKRTLLETEQADPESLVQHRRGRLERPRRQATA